MEVKIDKKTASAKLNFKGESHTFINLLRESLWAAGAEGAAYRQDHPLKDDITVLVQGKPPASIIKKAASAIAKEAASLRRAASKL